MHTYMYKMYGGTHRAELVCNKDTNMNNPHEQIHAQSVYMNYYVTMLYIDIYIYIWMYEISLYTHHTEKGKFIYIAAKFEYM